jgi:putative hydrolase of the HAD superfamily
MHPRALLIDAMGTLLTLDSPAARLVSALRDELGAEVTEAQARAALGAEIAHYRAHMAEARDAASLRGLRAECAGVLREALPPLPDMAAVEGDRMVGILLSALHFRPFPDALRLLERSRTAGIRSIVVSNWDVSLPEVLGRAGLAPWLDGVVVSAAVGAAKPSPVIFARALALAGVGAGECLHVGDSPVEDVAGASAAGIEVVLLDRAAVPLERGGETRRRDGVRVIATLDELPL